MKKPCAARPVAWFAVLAIGLTGSAIAAELDGPASIVFDANRVPTILAQTEHDAIYLQGYMHARDRLFQMDFQRHLFSGRVAELVGSAGVPQDVQLRTLGLRRAAERSLLVQTPEVMAWLEAYSDGVNALIEDTSIPLPIEYGALELTRASIEPWTPLDSLTMAKGLAFGLSFDLGDIDRTLALLNFLGVGEVLGFNGLQLFNTDLYRTAPFDPTVSIPGVVLSAASAESAGGECANEFYQPVDLVRSCPFSPPFVAPLDEEEELPAYYSDPNFGDMVRNYRDTISEIPILARALEFDQSAQGSNWWVVSGALTDSGFPIIASDPHLSLGTPSTFYEVHLSVAGGMNVTGVSFPGAPGVVLGCNDTICWGGTVNSMDVTDVFNEVLLPLNPMAPTQPTHTLFEGSPEPLVFIPQTFFVNIVGDSVPNNLVNAGVPATSGGVTMVVPRRNNGPIVNVTVDLSSPTPITGLAVQYTGWSGTQELEAFRLMARASSMQDFKDALQFFDVGSQNWAYADINGNIAYYTSGELPIRQDLQTIFFPAGLAAPNIIRDGTNEDPHQWLPLANPQPHQSLSTEILPFSEMPQVENPAAGYILNANNDPIGTTLDNVAWNQFRAGFNGLLYLASGYDAGYRIGRLQQLFDDALAGAGTVSIGESIAFQGDNQLLDAQVLKPYLLQAFANASAGGAPPELAPFAGDAQLAEALSRLAAWDTSTPTGIIEGFDPGDNPLAPTPPTPGEIDRSVAATIYSAWRGQIVQRVIDTTLSSLPVPLNTYAPGNAQAMTALRRLLDTYGVNGGTGASLLNFFTVPGISDQAVARDVILLGELREALDLLASPAFAPAFGESTDLEDYRWGKLHRIVLAHFLGGPFNVPPPGSPLNLSPSLPGFSRAGGMGTLDASAHSVRADGLNEFMFSSGPARRLVATMAPGGPEALEVIPGGQSGAPGSPYQVDQLGLWLVNAYHPLPVDPDDVVPVATESYACGDGDETAGEECDDGNTTSGDGCSAECVLEFCGDGTTQGGIGEECDDGNNADGDGCSAVCVLEFCGDGTVQAGLGEQCDDGNDADGDGCSAGCVVEFCGDGTVQSGLGEQCDDGNTMAGDGCSPTCTVEAEPIPTASEWGLIAMGLLLLMAGAWVFSRLGRLV